METTRRRACEILDSKTAEASTKTFHKNQWGLRHARVAKESAEYPTKTTGHALHAAIVAWAAYADAHHDRYESGIGEDGVLGADWEAIGLALERMLCGELGGLDAGVLDDIIGEILKNEGIAF